MPRVTGNSQDFVLIVSDVSQEVRTDLGPGDLLVGIPMPIPQGFRKHHRHRQDLAIFTG